jgi:predicted dehydrogenase/nucleoside-diphosphate-sugar epimerase
MAIPFKVALVGAGNIAAVHAAVLNANTATNLTHVIDIDAASAAALASRYRCAVAASIDAVANEVDAIHVLTPPATHRAVADQALGAGAHVIVEKPMASTLDDCRSLQTRSTALGRQIGVNQNFVFHPAFRRLKQAVAAGEIGQLRHVACLYHMPLRQLAAGQLGHWMFQSSTNLLLEQAVHPLSQLDDLAGPLTIQAAIPSPRSSAPDWACLVTGWSVACAADGVTATLHFSLGETHPCWRITAIGSDGMLEADIIRNLTVRQLPSRWLEAIDDAAVSTSGGLQQVAQAIRNLSRYSISTAGLRPRSDPFFKSMTASLGAFYDDLAGSRHPAQSEPGARLVAMCEAIGGTAPRRSATRPKAPAPRSGQPATVDVLVIGGTGFIGRRLVARLVAEGRTVGVLARGVRGLPPLFAAPRVRLTGASVTDEAAIRDAVRTAPVIVHLAHGGGGDQAAIERSMVGGARLVAEAAMDANVRHLVFVSSIAALYLGDPATSITAASSADPDPDARADYARGKILAERLLVALAAEKGLPSTIVRPGVVLGPGTSPFHSGIGWFNREMHCLGWNAGTNPLPLVLVDDVATALTALIDRPASPDHAYNLVGDVRPTARRYIERLAEGIGRPLRYHPQSVTRQLGIETGKWAIKRLAGRDDVARPTARDLRSRGLLSPFDTSFEQHSLNWRPETDEERFFAEILAA